MPSARCLPCFGDRCDAVAGSCAAARASRVALLVAADAPAALPASLASLALERRDSVQSQWAAAAPASGGRPARRITAAAPDRAERLRRAFSLAAALLPAASRATQQRGAPTPAAQLDARLASLRLRRARVDGDGNCLFRALAASIFGDQARHAAMRAAVVAQLRSPAGAAAFVPLFAEPAAYALYCADMAEAGTWGDELGLAAAAEAFGVQVHVIQDTEQHWHVAYAPSLHRQADGRTHRAFVAYTAPVHYDAIVPTDDAI